METVNQSNYLGKEKLSKLLAKFAIPCILSLIISCLYNIVDQIFVGNIIGTAGNAATGIIFPITVVGWGASLFFGDGAAAYLSMALGKGETKKIPASVGNAVLMSFISGIVIIAIAYIGGDDLLTVLGAKDTETLQLASAYGKIIYAMMPLAPCLHHSCGRMSQSRNGGNVYGRNHQYYRRSDLYFLYGNKRCCCRNNSRSVCKLYNVRFVPSPL